MEFIDKLRIEFEAKIKNEWEEKWSSFGVYDPLKNNRRSKFYTALAAEISRTTNCTVSRDTVNRFDKTKGGDSEASLNAFSRYLNYDSFQLYASEIAVNKTERKSFSRRIMISVFLIVTIAAVLCYYYLQVRSEKEKIIQVIKSANKSQFKAFLSLPIVDSSEISSYYLKTGSAYKSILTLLKENKNTHRTLSQPEENPSYQKLFSLEVIDLERNNAVVKTSEHWFLKWYDSEKSKYTISYDVQNEQIYELIKKGDTWFIDNNYYQGKATSIDF